VTADTLLVDKLRCFQPLDALSPTALKELASVCCVERVSRNLDPFRLRDWEGQVIFLLKGELKLQFADDSISVLVGGTGDALRPLGAQGVWPAASKAITDIELLRIDEDMLDIVLTWDQLSSPGQPAQANQREATDWRTLSGIFALRKLTQGAFASLPPAHIQALFDRFQRVPVQRGQVIVREGDAGDYYYLIERGRCQVTRKVGGGQVELAELEAGDAFGDEALVAETSRNATVTMKTGGVLLRLAKPDFVELLREPLLRRLDPAAARQRVAAGAVWLDVRFPAEYQHDGLPGAINIPINEVREAFSMLDRDKEFVVYCQTGRRSSAAAFLLSQRGFSAYLLEGGLRAWLAESRERKMK
jgi:rhodanese-related sulfurtransferase